MKKERVEVIDDSIVNTDIDYKLRVFISSNCEEKYERVKLKLKEALIKTGLMEVYCFEDAPGSSMNVVGSYLPEVEQCDLFLVFIDNYDGIKEGTRKEIECAKTNKKKKIYVFCNERSKEKTTIQEELVVNGSEKFIEIDNFEDFPLKAYKSVMQDLVLYVRDIKKEEFDEFIEEKYSNYLTNDESFIIKGSVNNNTYVRNMLIRKHFNEKFLEKPKSISDLDVELANQLDFVLLNRKFDEKQHEKLQNEILKLHKGKIKDVVRERLVIQRKYYKGEYEECLFELRELIGKSVEKKVPNWLYLDIAIDIRHVQSLLDEKNSKFSIENIGQEYINNNNESLFYPIIDRKVSEFNKKIIDKYYSELNKSPYSILYENLEYMFYPISDAFIAAQLYGSIVNTTIIRKRLIDLYACLLNIYDDHELLIEYLRLLIIENDTKRIDECIRKSSNIPYLSSNDEINHVLDSVNNNYDSYRKKVSILDTLAYFGYYMDDKTFEKYNKYAKYYVEEWINSDKPIYNMWNHINNYLSNIKYRLGDLYIVDTIIKVIANRCYTIRNREYFKILTIIDYSKLAKKRQKEVMGILKSVINKEYIDEIQCQDYAEALIIFCKQATIDITSLEKLVKKKEYDFYQNYLSLELIDKHNSNPSKYIENHISTIKNYITMAKKGMYTDSSDYKTIFNILFNTTQKIEKELLIEIVHVCKQGLEAKELTAQSKIYSIQLLQLINSKYSKSVDIKSIKKEITNEIDKYSICSDAIMFNKTKEKHLRLAIELFLSTDSKYDSNKVLDVIYSKFNNDGFDSVESLELIYQFLQAQLDSDISNNLLNNLLYYVYSKTSDSERNVKYKSSLCLIELTKYHNVEEKAFKYLSTIFDNSSPEIKATIASRVKNIKNKDKYVDNLIDKAKNNNNFFVRYSVNYI